MSTWSAASQIWRQEFKDQLVMSAVGSDMGEVKGCLQGKGEKGRQLVVLQRKSEGKVMDVCGHSSTQLNSLEIE